MRGGALSHSMSIKPKGLGNRFYKSLIKKSGQRPTPRLPEQCRPQGLCCNHESHKGRIQWLTFIVYLGYVPSIMVDAPCAEAHLIQRENDSRAGQVMA